MAQKNETKSTETTLTINKSLSVEGDVTVTGTINGALNGNATSATTLGTSSAGYTYTTLKSAIDSCVMDGDTITLDGGSSTVNI